MVNPRLCQAGAAQELYARCRALRSSLREQHHIGSETQERNRVKLSVVSNQVSEELPDSYLMLLDHPSASIHNRGARSPFPAFPDSHHLMSTTLVEEKPAPPPFPTEATFLLAFSCSFPQEKPSAEASPAAAGPSWAPLQRWPLGAGTEVSWLWARGGPAMGLSGTGRIQEHHVQQEESSGNCLRVSQKGKYNSRSVSHNFSFHCSLTTKCFLCKQLEHSLLPPI